ncbi:hypothetical protein EYF80_012371 [Liparis tanakae]|uniref:Uncharacterized protein n=1 Tax=Liparis tanakae TaxID=230148 RepID=A0A4Z2II08_9TELE|nr:hypothetical protein EYF80_012371 [Liparis tanakae]
MQREGVIVQLIAAVYPFMSNHQCLYPLIPMPGSSNQHLMNSTRQCSHWYARNSWPSRPNTRTPSWLTGFSVATRGTPVPIPAPFLDEVSVTRSPE